MKSPSMSVSCIAGLITFVYLINVHANPLQDQCNKEKPVICPAYGICCRADQFCYNKSGTCEDCFPVEISERQDRLKFCSDIQRKRTTRTMRDDTCVGACIAFFDMTEIINYTDKDPVKTQAQLVYELLQEKVNHLNKTLDQRIKQELSNFNSSMHEFREKVKIDINDFNSSMHDDLEKVKKDINDDTKEKGTQEALIIAIIALILVIILVIVVIVKLMKSKINKMQKTKIPKNAFEEEHLPQSSKHTNRSVKKQDKNDETDLRSLLSSPETNDEYDDKRDDQEKSKYQSSGLDVTKHPEPNGCQNPKPPPIPEMQEEKYRVEQDVDLHSIDPATGTSNSRTIGGYIF